MQKLRQIVYKYADKYLWSNRSRIGSTCHIASDHTPDNSFVFRTLPGWADMSLAQWHPASVSRVFRLPFTAVAILGALRAPLDLWKWSSKDSWLQLSPLLPPVCWPQPTHLVGKSNRLREPETALECGRGREEELGDQSPREQGSWSPHPMGLSSVSKFRSPLIGRKERRSIHYKASLKKESVPRSWSNSHC